MDNSKKTTKLNLFSLNFSNSIILLLFLVFNSLSRLTLLCFAAYNNQITLNFIDFFQTLTLGLLNDAITSIYFLTPLTLISLLIPAKFHKNFLTYLFYFCTIIALGFLIISEFTFWLEFDTRFNFIAVDYLVYTHEVIGNIRESYPIGLIFSILFIISGLIYYYFHDLIKEKLSLNYGISRTLKQLFALSFIVIAIFYCYDPKITDNNNNYLSELNKNGLYNLFSAFRHNSIDYNSFYKTRDQKQNFVELFSYLTQQNQKPINENLLEREIKTEGPKKDYNIFIITIESLSSELLTATYKEKSITPIINNLIKESLYFDNFYAVGTRTVRGLEAITLAIPPMPGQSLIRRENNKNLFSLSSVLAKENYDLKFIYGGLGYFDNMNDFFLKNGFKVLDRNNFPEAEIKFENIWGVSDGDLYTQAIKQADLSFKQNKKFLSLLMTTSNHRPYTYPEGAIDIPNKTIGRYAAVKYTDYALGEFLKSAKEKPWFNNTIFVITADHCAGSAGRIALPPEKYHIPLLIYAPNIVKPQVIHKLSSQIDLAPTVIGLLNIPYKSRFFGNDILTKNYQNAFISTFQKLGYIENNKLIVLMPGKTSKTYNILENQDLVTVDDDNQLTDRAISYYQTIYYLYQNGLLNQNAK